MVIGIVTTSAILVLGGFFITMALSYNTRYEQLGIMLMLVFILGVLAVAVHALRRKIIRMRLEVDDNGLRWKNLNERRVRRFAWTDLVRFQVTPVHHRGRVVGHELRLWTRFERSPLVIRQDVENAERHEDFLVFQKQMTTMLRDRQITRR